MFRECSHQLKLPEVHSRWESVGSCAERKILSETVRFPVAIGISARNRFMKSAMSEQLASFDKDPKKTGLPSAELINLYRKFDEGEFGVIVTGCMPVSWKEIEFPGNVVLDAEGRTPERLKLMKDWTDATEKNGAVFLAQLYHPGKRSSDWVGGPEKFDPGAVSKKELQDLIEKFIDAAVYAETCGFNGVEVPCAYSATLGYLITNGMNKRTDEYGGSMKNRMKALLEIITGIRKRVKDNAKFVVGVKLNAYNMAHGYIDSEFRSLLKDLEDAEIDYLVLTGGHYGLLKDIKSKVLLQSQSPVDSVYKPMATAAKEVLKNVKVYMNGSFVTVSDMTNAVREGWATGISLARPAAAETDLPKKIGNGSVDGAVKSVIDLNDFPTSIALAGTQLWQNGADKRVLDASNAEDVENFKNFLAKHQQAVENANETPIVGWAKFAL